MIVFHPDLLTKYPLGRKIGQYGFFAYEVHEALHLSAHEEALLDGLVDAIRAEYERLIDAFSQDVLVSQLEVLLNYANRFYHRQFLTRRTAEPNDDSLLTRFESRLNAYFAQEPGSSRTRFETLVTKYFTQEPAGLAGQHLPTVQHFADELNVSPAYLSDMLRSLTGQNTQQHIHHALIERAKRLLATTSLSINETAFQLGFEYPPYFSRLFKNKTGQTPAEYRLSMQ